MKMVAEAIRRAYDLVGTGTYLIGDGQHGLDPHDYVNGRTFGWRLDCIGFVLWCYDIPRHRLGFNHGPWATVEDDINTDSAIEDARHRQELFVPVDTVGPLPGDLVIYHTDKANGVRFGHVGLVVRVSFAGALTVIQSHGPNGAKMAVITDDSIWRHHTSNHPHNPSMYLRIKGT